MKHWHHPEVDCRPYWMLELAFIKALDKEQLADWIFRPSPVFKFILQDKWIAK